MGKIVVVRSLFFCRVYVDRISIELSILHFKGSQIEITKLLRISVTNICFIFANSANPDETQTMGATINNESTTAEPPP